MLVFQEKIKTLLGIHSETFFYQCKSRIYTVVWYELLAFSVAVFGIDIAGQLWRGLLRNSAFLRRQRGEALRHQVVLDISMITITPKSLLESPLCRSTCMIGLSHASLSLHYCKVWQWLHFNCLGLIPGIPEVLMDGMISSGLSFECPSCSWVKICWGVPWRGVGTPVCGARAAVYQLQNLS